MTEFHFLQLLSLIAIASLAWLTPKRWQMDCISLLTMGLLGWFSITSLVLLCFSAGLIFWGAKKNSKQKGFITVLLIVYCGLQFLTLRTLQLYIDEWKTLSVLGLAYYTCRHIHYLVESYNKDVDGIMLIFLWPCIESLWVMLKLLFSAII